MTVTLETYVCIVSDEGLSLGVVILPYHDSCPFLSPVNGLLSASGEIIEFEIPTEEKILSTSTISEEEKRVHADFFDGRAPKTPERYLKIRNYIIDCW